LQPQNAHLTAQVLAQGKDFLDLLSFPRTRPLAASITDESPPLPRGVGIRSRPARREAEDLQGVDVQAVLAIIQTLLQTSAHLLAAAKHIEANISS